jgi:hypothetical protein
MTDALKEFVPYEIALELKQLGFDEPCLAFYNGKFLDSTQYDFDNCSMKDIGQCLLAPTYSQAFRWFRENHKIHSYIEWFDNGQFDYTLTSAKFEEEVFYDDGPFDTEQEAQNACLKRLLNEVK